MTRSRHDPPDSREGTARGGTGSLARRALRRGVPALAAVALLLAGIADTSPLLYAAGVLACALVLAAVVGGALSRSGYRRPWRWAGGLLAATVAVAVGLGLPWWALRRAYDGDPVWTVDYFATWSSHHGERVYLADAESALAVDLRTGRVLGRVPNGGDPRVLDGIGFGLAFGSPVAAYDGSARLLWERPSRGKLSFVAATEKTTVLESCRAGSGCHLEGIGADGRTRWSRPSIDVVPNLAYSHSPSRTPSLPAPDVLPRVVVWRAEAEALDWIIADADDGHLLGRLSVTGSDYVGAVGDTAIVSDRAGGYRFRGIRGGHLAWTVSLPSGAPSRDGEERAAPFLLFPTRMYARLEGGKGVTIDLGTGRHRVMDLDPLAENVAASGEVLVVREGRRGHAGYRRRLRSRRPAHPPVGQPAATRRGAPGRRARHRARRPVRSPVRTAHLGRWGMGHAAGRSGSGARRRRRGGAARRGGAGPAIGRMPIEPGPCEVEGPRGRRSRPGGGARAGYRAPSTRGAAWGHDTASGIARPGGRRDAEGRSAGRYAIRSRTVARGSDTGDERQAPVRCWCLPLLALAVMLLGSCAEDAAACAGRTWDLRTPPSREDVGMPPGREWVAWECDDPREMTFRLPGEAALRVPSTLVTFDAYGARRPETGDPTTADVHTGPLGLDAAARLATGILRRLGTDAGEIGEWRARAAAATSTDYVRSLFIRSRVGYLGVEVRTTYMPLSKSAFVHIIFNFTPPPGE